MDPHVFQKVSICSKQNAGLEFLCRFRQLNTNFDNFPKEQIEFGATHNNFPCEFIGFGAMDGDFQWLKLQTAIKYD
jgi:hypothetical protein